MGLVFVLALESTHSADNFEDINEARVCVTGADHNRPDAFSGLGDFIGWPGGIERMPNGDLRTRPKRAAKRAKQQDCKYCQIIASTMQNVFISDADACCPPSW